MREGGQTQRRGWTLVRRRTESARQGGDTHGERASDPQVDCPGAPRRGRRIRPESRLPKLGEERRGPAKNPAGNTLRFQADRANLDRGAYQAWLWIHNRLGRRNLALPDDVYARR